MKNCLVLDDSDIHHLVDIAGLVAVAEQCFHAKATGNLVGPPRHRVVFGAGSLVFTIGGLTAHDGSPGLAGFRVYETFSGTDTDRNQIVAVWNSSTGAFEGLILGELLGVLRTGAIGAIAVKYMSAPDAAVCAVIGSGRQAEAQLMATAAARPSLRIVRVFSRSLDNRERFAVQMSKRLGLSVASVASAREAVADADVVLCATDSPTPILESNWLKRGAHVSSVGPKLVDEHELPTDVVDRSDIVATDSIAQVHSSGKAFFLHGTPAWARMIDLAEIVTGRAAGRNSNTDLTLFCSVGLAGTEVVIASTILREWQREQKGGGNAQREY